MDCKHIRNFSIIAHIDHGKSTLADRLLESTGTVEKRQLKEQMLDDMELERQRGITIKARAVRMEYRHKGERYELNLIDTPGHVDFHYEVSRSLACCEGALLLVDAFQGVEAQTVANAYAAINLDLTIVPVINKVDLVHARVEEVLSEMEQSLAIDPTEVIRASAKTGIGIDELLAAIIERIPPPKGDPEATLRAMIFDSHYDSYRGAITYVRLIDGTITKGQKIRFLETGVTHEVLELGQFVPQRRACETLSAGQVGYLVCNIKDVKQVHIGDTVTIPGDHAAAPMPGYKPPQRMVYCGLYPSEGENFEELRDALEKLAINDPSFEYAPESSEALGFGFRCGFLGLLHMEIIQQRLEKEHDLDLVQTAPNVTYRIKKTTGETIDITNPQDVPDTGQIDEFLQPIVRTNFLVPVEQIGPVMQLRVPLADAGDAHLRPAARRGDLRPARQAQERDPRLRHDGLRARRLLPRRPRAARHPRGRQESRRALDHLRPPRRRPPRPGDRQEAPRRDRPPHVRDRPAGRDRHEGDRPRDDLRDAEERDGQVLRRRHLPQEEALGEAEGRQEADEEHRLGGHPAEGLHGGARHRCRPAVSRRT